MRSRPALKKSKSKNFYKKKTLSAESNKGNFAKAGSAARALVAEIKISQDNCRSLAQARYYGKKPAAHFPAVRHRLSPTISPIKRALPPPRMRRKKKI